MWQLDSPTVTDVQQLCFSLPKASCIFIFEFETHIKVEYVVGRENTHSSFGKRKKYTHTNEDKFKER